jgi:hypothetical protein
MECSAPDGEPRSSETTSPWLKASPSPATSTSTEPSASKSPVASMEASEAVLYTRRSPGTPPAPMSHTPTIWLLLDTRSGLPSALRSGAAMV